MGNRKKQRTILVLSAPPRSGHNFLKQNLCSWLGIDWRLDYWNYEGTIPAHYLMRFSHELKKINQAHSKRGLPMPKFVSVVSNRDLLDWMASIFRQSQNAGRSLHPLFLHPWISYTEEIFGITNHIPDSIRITYDQFLSSEEYRREVCQNIGGEYNESQLDFVPGPGQGSSFDTLSYRGKGSQMKTTERYLHYVDNQIYRETLETNKEAVELYLKTFQPPKEKVQFIESLDLKYQVKPKVKVVSGTTNPDV